MPLLLTGPFMMINIYLMHIKAVRDSGDKIGKNIPFLFKHMYTGSKSHVKRGC